MSKLIKVCIVRRIFLVQRQTVIWPRTPKGLCMQKGPYLIEAISGLKGIPAATGGLVEARIQIHIRHFADKQFLFPCLG